MFAQLLGALLPASTVTTGFVPGGPGFLHRTPACAAKGVGGG
ncbi:MAG TPA: hypothetical protein VGP05_17515 [Pseudonocardia sp.]|nr:hypothetical protein [Pseudonocardia sp.]